ncbi:MAG: hypothetical protein ABSB81_02755 [Halobacteriota archaeon]|jgi:hypothetical protein
MSNESALGTGKTDGQDVLERIINNNIVIFHWQEKRVSDHVAQISIAGCEDSSLPVLTFKATGFAQTFETPQHAEAFVVSNTVGFIHVGNMRGDAYIQDRSIAEQLRLHLVLKPTSERTILSCELTFASSGALETLN